eukprot:scaffold12041_cov27-Prasinocladus_malaysianus.AAC.1
MSHEQNERNRPVGVPSDEKTRQRPRPSLGPQRRGSQSLGRSCPVKGIGEYQVKRYALEQQAVRSKHDLVYWRWGCTSRSNLSARNEMVLFRGMPAKGKGYLRYSRL